MLGLPKRLLGVLVVAGALVSVPSPAASQEGEACWMCFPQQGPNGYCRVHGHGDYTGCDPVPGGGCNFVPYETGCGVETVALGIYEEMPLAGGAELIGLEVAPDAFAVMTCAGTTRYMVYSDGGAEKRKDLAKRIVLTAQGD